MENATTKSDLVTLGVKIPRDLDVRIEIAVARRQCTKQVFLTEAFEAAVAAAEAAAAEQQPAA